MGVKLGRWSRYRPAPRASEGAAPDGVCLSLPRSGTPYVTLAVMRSGRHERGDLIVEDESEDALI